MVLVISVKRMDTKEGITMACSDGADSIYDLRFAHAPTSFSRFNWKQNLLDPVSPHTTPACSDFQ